MNLHKYLERKKEIQNNFLTLIEKDDYVEENYQSLIEIIDNQKIQKNQYELKLILYLIVKISNHHYRRPNFFNKIERVLLYMQNEIKTNFSNIEIFNIFKSNKRLLLFILENQLINIDKSIIESMTKYKYYKSAYFLYFFPEFKSFIRRVESIPLTIF